MNDHAVLLGVISILAILAGPIFAVQAQVLLERRREATNRKMWVFKTLRPVILSFFGSLPRTADTVFLPIYRCANLPIVTKRELQCEVTRLRARQLKARQDEPFLGLSSQEKEEYDARTDRIHDLDVQLEALGLAEEASASQRRDWNRTSETDTPQSGSHQPYRDPRAGFEPRLH